MQCYRGASELFQQYYFFGLSDFHSWIVSKDRQVQASVDRCNAQNRDGILTNFCSLAASGDYESFATSYLFVLYMDALCSIDVYNTARVGEASVNPEQEAARYWNVRQYREAPSNLQVAYAAGLADMFLWLAARDPQLQNQVDACFSGETSGTNSARYDSAVADGSFDDNLAAPVFVAMWDVVCGIGVLDGTALVSAGGQTGPDAAGDGVDVASEAGPTSVSHHSVSSFKESSVDYQIEYTSGLADIFSWIASRELQLKATIDECLEGNTREDVSAMFSGAVADGASDQDASALAFVGMMDEACGSDIFHMVAIGTGGNGGGGGGSDTPVLALHSVASYREQSVEHQIAYASGLMDLVHWIVSTEPASKSAIDSCVAGQSAADVLVMFDRVAIGAPRGDAGAPVFIAMLDSQCGTELLANVATVASASAAAAESGEQCTPVESLPDSLLATLTQSGQLTALYERARCAEPSRTAAGNYRGLIECAGHYYLRAQEPEFAAGISTILHRISVN